MAQCVLYKSVRRQLPALIQGGAHSPFLRAHRAVSPAVCTLCNCLLLQPGFDRAAGVRAPPGAVNRQVAALPPPCFCRSFLEKRPFFNKGRFFCGHFTFSTCGIYATVDTRLWGQSSPATGPRKVSKPHMSSTNAHNKRLPTPPSTP